MLVSDLFGSNLLVALVVPASHTLDPHQQWPGGFNFFTWSLYDNVTVVCPSSLWFFHQCMSSGELWAVVAFGLGADAVVNNVLYVCSLIMNNVAPVSTPIVASVPLNLTVTTIGFELLAFVWYKEYSCAVSLSSDFK